MSISHLFNIGQSALYAQQSTIATTGNNIANVDTPGYSRQYVQLEDAYTLQGKPGGQGMGVDATQVIRRFDEFVEVSFLDKSTEATRWEEQYRTLTSVESIFNESNRTGINDALSAFFGAWQDLALRPDDPATRQNLISLSDDLALLMSKSQEDLDQIKQQMNLNIEVDVERVNELSKEIAALNEQISRNTIEGRNNPNDLLDKRDTAVRELATYVDITTQTTAEGEYVVSLGTGQPLVQGQVTYDLQVMNAQSESNKMNNSTYQGEVTFVGEDAYEYTVEMLTGGNAGDDPPPSYKVSLDGGVTWLRDSSGNVQEFTVTDNDGDGVVDPVQVHNIEISFTETDNFTEGDRFTIVPKTGLYWIEPTRGPQNITPMTHLDGTESQDRLTGGTLTAHFTVRDVHVGHYQDELNAVADALIWEVNKLHSQGGSVPTNFFAGSERVGDTEIALGLPQSGLHSYDRLTEGTITFHVYDKETGAYMEGKTLDFDDTIGGVQAFDPAVHTLEDVQDAFNRTFPNSITATIVDDKLVLNSADPALEFAGGEDTSGLMAALGINTYFQGNSADDISVNTEVHMDHNRINAGYVDGDDQLYPGDNATTAQGIGKLMTETVEMSTPWRTTTSQSISEYYSTLVARVGADVRTAQTNAEYNTALANDLSDQQQAVSGVNLDEEMANLIKFQHAYTAAAKLITTADQMLETLLGLKQ